LIFLAATGVSVTFCSRSFHPFRCDFVAALLRKNKLQRNADHLAQQVGGGLGPSARAHEGSSSRRSSVVPQFRLVSATRPNGESLVTTAKQSTQYGAI
jgi:hypothetical protein